MSEPIGAHWNWDSPASSLGLESAVVLGHGDPTAIEFAAPPGTLYMNLDSHLVDNTEGLFFIKTKNTDHTGWGEFATRTNSWMDS